MFKHRVQRREKTGNDEGEGPVQSVSIAGTHLNLRNPMKHKLCEAKIELRKLKPKQ